MNGMIDRRGVRVGGTTRPLGTNPTQERWRVTGRPRREAGLTHWFGVESATGQIVRGVVVDLGARAESELERAAQALWTVEHRSVPKPLAIGRNSSGELVVVYAADRSPTLVSLLSEGALNPARVVALGHQLFDALGAAHAAGLTHGALSADQIRVASEGDRELLLVEGIGLRALSPLALPTVDVAADLHAAGQILHQMLLGQLAPDFRRTAAYGVRAFGSAPEDGDAHEHGLLDDFPYAGPLVDLIRQCLDPRASARPASAWSARDTLGHIADPWEAARPRRAGVPEIAVAPVEADPPSRRIARVRPVTAPFEPAPIVDSVGLADAGASNERLWATIVAAVLAIIAVLIVALPDRPASASSHSTMGSALVPLPPVEAPPAR